MKQDPPVQPRERHRTICGVCSLVMVRLVARTLAPEVFFGDCSKCGKPTMQRDVGGPIDEPPPEPQPDYTPLTVDQAEELATRLDDGEPMLAGDPEICPECQEIGRHDPGCPFPGTLHQAYLRWRGTDDGKVVVDSIRKRALELRARGWSHYGIQALAEVARYDRALSIGPDADGFRVNNSHLSRLARDLMRETDDLDGFFEVRELRSIR